MAPNRSEDRNVHIFDAKDPNVELGGLILTPGITNTKFYSMLEIIFPSSGFCLQNESGSIIAKNNHLFQPGNYYIVGVVDVTPS